MTRETNLNWQTRLLFAVIATCAVLSAVGFLAVAQDRQFKIGERVEVKISSTYGWEICTVTENPPQGLMKVRCEARNGRPAGVFIVYDKRDVRPLSGATSRGDDKTESNEPSSDAGATPTENRRTYKVGDLVEASPFFKESEWRPCRVAEISSGNSLKVWCEEHNGLPSGTFSVTTRWVRPRTTRTADDNGADSCSYTAPAGTVSSAAKPSEQLFKRVIYDHYNEETQRATPRPLKVGITFQTFQMGRSYVNRLTGRGLMYDGAPQGATIYPVKTKYVWCRQYQSSVYRYVMETSFACFKDKFGNWDCPVDGVPKFLEQKDFPILRQ